MTKEREALKLALEALEWNLPVVEDWGGKDNLSLQHKAITAIREALAQPEQEPVAWMTITPYGEEDDIWYENPEGKLLDDWTYKPLYTTPPQPEPVIDKSAAIRIATSLGWEPKRTWVGLTDEEIDTILKRGDVAEHDAWNGRWYVLPYSLTRAVEAKLKEKNNV